MTKAVDIELLRAQIWALNGSFGGAPRVASLGVAEMDAALPWGGLPMGRLHRLGGETAAARQFCAVLAARLPSARPILWVTRDDAAPFDAAALARFGLTADRLIVVRATSETDLLWTVAEAARCPGLAAVVADAGPLGASAEARLRAIADTTCVTAFVIAAHPAEGADAATVWTLRAAPPPPGRPGIPHWLATLERPRGAVAARPASWFLEWDDVTANPVLPDDFRD